MSQTKKEEVVLLACRDASGAPRVVPFTVSVTEEERDLGVHYDRAENQALEHDYNPPFVPFDSDEVPGLISDVDDAVSYAAEANGCSPNFSGYVVNHEHRHGSDAYLVFSSSGCVDEDYLQIVDPHGYELQREDEFAGAHSLPYDLGALVNLLAQRAHLGHQASRESMNAILEDPFPVSISEAFERLWNAANEEKGERFTFPVNYFETTIQGASCVPGEPVRVVAMDNLDHHFIAPIRFAVELPLDPEKKNEHDRYLVMNIEEHMEDLPAVLRDLDPHRG